MAAALELVLVYLLGSLLVFSILWLVAECAGKEVQRPWWQALGALRAALPLVRGLSGRVGAVWRRALLVELLVAIIVVSSR